jgi:hypothetical protein
MTLPLAILATFLFESTAFAFPGPTLIGINPASGPTTGGTTVIITGTLFTGGFLGTAIGVNFGTTPAVSFTINSSTIITATSPAEAAGTVDITVTFADPLSTPTSPADQFTFIAPAITSTPALEVWSMMGLAFLLAGMGYLRLMKASGGSAA